MRAPCPADSQNLPSAACKSIFYHQPSPAIAYTALHVLYIAYHSLGALYLVC
jgi:hypothetical protein